MTFSGEPRADGVALDDMSGADWLGLCAFVVPERTALQMSEAIAGIVRGVEVLEVLRIAEDRRAAVLAHLGPDRRFPAVAGEPHSLVVSCDVPPAPGPAGIPRVAARVESVARHTSRRLLGPDARPGDALRHSLGRRDTVDLIALAADPSDPGLRARLAAKLRQTAELCTFPFPVVRMLGAESPGYRARVALVDHPVHGRSVCKIFRPGATAFFRRELAARTTLADQPLVPRLLEHGPNWMLTPEYTDDGAHRLRPLPGVAGMHQLRPSAARALARFAVTMHERGMFMLDLSPQNLMSDPRAGLTVIDLEFVLPYAEFDGPPPPLAAAWSYRGVPAEAIAKAELPTLALTKGVGNAVFHPAVAGLPIERLLGPDRRRDRLRRRATQLGWYATLGAVGPVRAALARIAPGRAWRKRGR